MTPLEYQIEAEAAYQRADAAADQGNNALEEAELRKSIAASLIFLGKRA